MLIGSCAYAETHACLKANNFNCGSTIFELKREEVKTEVGRGGHSQRTKL